MSRVEVIVEGALENGENKWFTWSVKMGLKEFGIVDTMVNGMDYVFVVEGDMFELFEKMYRYLEYSKFRWGADAKVVMCGGNECIDMSWVDGLMGGYMIIIPKDEIMKLKMVRDRIKRMFEKNVGYADMVGDGGRIWIYLNRCKTYVYGDEAVALAGLILDVLYRETGREEYREMRDMVYEVFRPEEFKLNISIKRGYVCQRHDLFHVWLDQCQACMSYEEVVDMAYSLLNLAIIGFMESRLVAEMEWGYE
jgi:hypothetical protein